MRDKALAIFEDFKIRRRYDEKADKWYFSVTDVIQALTGSANPRRYWSDLKRKLAAEGSQVYEKIIQLKMEAPDGRLRLTDVAEPEQLLRLIQSVRVQRQNRLSSGLQRLVMSVFRKHLTLKCP
jgi:hypothetical protein